MKRLRFEANRIIQMKNVERLLHAVMLLYNVIVLIDKGSEIEMNRFTW